MSQHLQKPSVTPRLVIGAEDHERLTSMAHGVASLDVSNPAARLIGELERARVVPQSKLPEGRINETRQYFRHTHGLNPIPAAALRWRSLRAFLVAA